MLQLKSGTPIVLESAPSKLRPIFDGEYDEKCSVKHFRDFLPDSEGCEEITSDNNWAYHLRIFWYSEEAPSCSQPPWNSIQQKIKVFLLSLENFMPDYWGKTAFVQFWAPITIEDGRRMLSVSKQPFAARQYLKGLCRYRYYCQECCNFGIRTEVGTDFGPVGRAFTRGSLEFSPHVDIYSQEDFPLKNLAKYCGVAGYLALPVFELGNGDTDGQQWSCKGVLEFISFTKNILSSFDTRICLKKLKDVGLAFRYPSYPEALTQIRPYFNFPPPGDACKGKPDEISSVLDLVRKAYSLPLIQVWLPCICNGSEVSVVCDPNSGSFSKVTHLVCGLKCLNRDERWSVWLSSYGCCDSQVYYVEDGEGWVGRAHSLKKICFIKDISRFRILDYPLVTLGQSDDLLAGFAAPLQLVNPKLPPLVLEVFLPTQYNFDENQGAILKAILSMVARELSKYNADFGLRLDEECYNENFQSNDDHDCVYEKIPAKEKPCLTYVRRKTKSVNHGRPVVEEDYVQPQQCQPSDATGVEKLQVPTEENMGPYIVPCHEPSGGQSSLKRKRRSYNVHPAQQTQELPSTSVDSSGEEQPSEIRYCLSDNSKEREEGPATILIPIPVEIPVCTNERVARIGPGNNEVDLDASIPSTNGKGKDTEPETDEVDHGTSIPTNGKCSSTVPENDEVDHGTFIPTNGKSSSTVPENDEVDHSCSMIVKARYEDDVVRFPFCSSSGIEGLRVDLIKRFELEVGRFKIKYLEDGDWIMLSCSEDLMFHMRALASSGKTTLDLSVFSTS